MVTKLFSLRMLLPLGLFATGLNVVAAEWDPAELTQWRQADYKKETKRRAKHEAFARGLEAKYPGVGVTVYHDNTWGVSFPDGSWTQSTYGALKRFARSNPTTDAFARYLPRYASGRHVGQFRPPSSSYPSALQQAQQAEKALDRIQAAINEVPSVVQDPYAPVACEYREPVYREPSSPIHCQDCGKRNLALHCGNCDALNPVLHYATHHPKTTALALLGVIAVVGSSLQSSH